MTIRIEPYKRASKGAKALSQRTGILRATPKQVKKHGTFDTVLNWGNSERRFNDAEYINDPEAVALASNKRSSAEQLGRANTAQPAFTTERVTAQEWFEDGITVVARTLLRASGGRGLVLCCPTAGDGSGGDDNTARESSGRNVRFGRDSNERNGRILRRSRSIVEAPLYTQYIKKNAEYRVHVFDDQVIDIQQKRKRQEVPNEEVDYQIRNTSNGWVFCRTDVSLPADTQQLCARAVSVLGLDFGAVDIIYNSHNNAYYILEVNTAPGLEGSTLDSYYEALASRMPCLQSGAYRRRRA